MTEITDESVVTCPACGHQQVEAMPESSCVIQLPCTACGVMMRPRPGDCCVFCSYGTAPCPVIQAERHQEQRVDAP